MASRELYSSYVTPKKKFTTARHALQAAANISLSPIEAMVGKNFYNPRTSSKEWDWMMQATDRAGAMANAGFMSIAGKFVGGGKGGGKTSSNVDVGKVGAGALKSASGSLGKSGGSTTQPIDAASSMQGTTPPTISQISQSNDFGVNRVKQHEFDVGDPSAYGYYDYKPILDNPSPAGYTNATQTFAQSQIGEPSLFNRQVGPRYMAKGGLRTLEGNTHEQGGIKLGQDEAEGGETMFNLDNQSDFIFSDRIKVPYSKQTFAQKSKRISSKYKLRPNDPYGKKSEEMELNNLAALQEGVKGNDIEDDGMFWGGGIFNKSNIDAINSGISYMNYPDFNSAQPPTQGMYNDNSVFKMTPLDVKKVDPTAGKIKSEKMELATYPDKSKNFEPSKSNFTLPALGYIAQVLTNIPALTTKPDKINSSRVKFGKLSLAEKRNEARRARNLALAVARGVGSNDIGQMMNYLSGTTAALNTAYGNQFNESLLQEQQSNLETNMREQLANSEIERYDEQINAQERDAARALRMNALQNIGTIAAMTGKDYLAMQQNDNYIAALAAANSDYGLNVRTPYRKRAYGGKIKRAMGGKY